MADERTERCETCRFWRHDDEDEKGVCFRHAPRPAAVTDCPDDSLLYYHPVWPLTMSEDWCGEYQPAPGAPPAGASAPPTAAILDEPLSELGLPGRTEIRLRKYAAITTVSFLMRFSAEELMRFHGIGEAVLIDVRSRLAVHGLRLPGDPAPPAGARSRAREPRASGARFAAGMRRTREGCR